jgi:hypothetical protein
MQKPWYYGKHLMADDYFLISALYPRLAAFAVVGAAGYYAGVLREHHMRTRDMVVKHYVETHQSDFDRLNDSELI